MLIRSVSSVMPLTYAGFAEMRAYQDVHCERVRISPVAVRLQYIRARDTRIFGHRRCPLGMRIGRIGKRGLGNGVSSVVAPTVAVLLPQHSAPLEVSDAGSTTSASGLLV